MKQIATLGGGCYWCLEAFYQLIEGIDKVTSGYSGGHVDNPTVDQVYAGNTGHAEVVQLEFDDSIITYQDILQIFFTMHDPTTLNRQGNDIGEEYRSVIFYHDESQRETAADLIKNFAPTLWDNPIVTELKPFTTFWKAEESMQDYYNRNPNAGYCQAIISPKVIKLRQKFAARLKNPAQ